MFGAPLKLWLVLLGALVITVLVVALVYFFGAARYSAGVSAENARWQEAARAAQQRAIRIGQAEGQAFARDGNALRQSLAQGQEDLHNAIETRDLLLAWARSDQRLCDAEAGVCGDRRT